MATVVKFKLQGAREMERTLKWLGPRVAQRAGDKALRAAAKPIVDEAKRLIPVKSGDLRASIMASTSSKGRKKDERLVLIGFRTPTSARAHFTEFGTYRSAAKPFMRPALDIMASAALNQMMLVLRDGINEALRKF